MIHGFTLIEVLVTSTIAAMFVTAVLGLTFRLERQRQVFQDKYQNQHNVELLRDVIRSDLLQCSGLSVGANELVLTGSLSTNPDGEPTLEPATVRYAIESGGRFYRHESSRGNNDRALLWIGIQKLDVAIYGHSGTGVPARVRCRIFGNGEKLLLDMSTMLIPGAMP
jgi:prepilin-type N-terminal cleavage/methylation domain-containing protein